MPTTAHEARLHVVVGILADRDGRFLIARRPPQVPGGGRWEFPGGKLEPGETPLEGVTRELWEEVGVTILAAEPLLKTCNDYYACRVLLDVWRIVEYRGHAEGREGQLLRWVLPREFVDFNFLDGNDPLLRAVAMLFPYKDDAE